MLAQIINTYTKRFDVHELYYEIKPRADTSLIICIPAFKEPDILTTLRSLAKCTPPSGTVELIIVVNAPHDATHEILEINAKTVSQINNWIEKEQPEFIITNVIREESISTKDAGAGMARKIGMDEAVQRWGMLNSDGPIICLDADCTVSSNYLLEGEKVFQDTAVKVGHFRFEHQFEKENDPVLRQGIIGYELHLRCYVAGLRQAGYPNAIHTVGSCMVVRASSYAKSGGMNRRKAGEDFYFLHKLIPLGGWRYISATVYPSCRVSDRVPFGTGRAQLEWLDNKQDMSTYNSELYQVLTPFFHATPNFYFEEPDLNIFCGPLYDFLETQKFKIRVDEMKKQSRTQTVFLKRYWQWMDGFMVLKLTHFLRDNGFPDQDTFVCGPKLLARGESDDIEKILKQFRQIDKG